MDTPTCAKDAVARVTSRTSVVTIRRRLNISLSSSKS